MNRFVGVSNGKEYELVAVNKELKTGLGNIEGFNSPQWCTYEKLFLDVDRVCGDDRPYNVVGHKYVERIEL